MSSCLLPDGRAAAAAETTYQRHMMASLHGKKHRGGRGTPIGKPPQRAGEAASAADDDRDEARRQQSVPIVGSNPGPAAAAAQAGKKDTNAKFSERTCDVDAERPEAVSRVVPARMRMPSRPKRSSTKSSATDGHGGDHEQAVTGDEEEPAQRVREHIRMVTGLPCTPPDESVPSRR
jgi:hypothetical protein